VIDCHFHMRADDHSTPEKRAEFADWVRSEAEAVGIEKICGMMGFVHFADSVEEARRKNGYMAKYVEEYPDLFYGWARINPEWGEAGVEEFRRAVEEDGLMGLKLYADVYIDDPRLDPYAEAAADMDVPIIHHVSGRPHYIDRPSDPSHIKEESMTEHVARRAERTPDLDLIAAHIGGGGDWEYRIKNLVDHDSVYLDISGTNCDSRIVEMAVDHLGADRCVFGTDNWLLPCVGKLRGADITEDQRETIAYRMRDIIEGAA
jgi:predicted TIM-barrel fold metal-dependent hydrolase